MDVIEWLREQFGLGGPRDPMQRLAELEQRYMDRQIARAAQFWPDNPRMQGLWLRERLRAMREHTGGLPDATIPRGTFVERLARTNPPTMDMPWRRVEPVVPDDALRTPVLDQRVLSNRRRAAVNLRAP